MWGHRPCRGPLLLLLLLLFFLLLLLSRGGAAPVSGGASFGQEPGQEEAVQGQQEAVCDHLAPTQGGYQHSIPLLPQHQGYNALILLPPSAHC